MVNEPNKRSARRTILCTKGIRVSKPICILNLISLFLNIIENFLCFVFSRKFAFIATLIYESVENIKKTMKYKQAMYKVFH